MKYKLYLLPVIFTLFANTVAFPNEKTHNIQSKIIRVAILPWEYGNSIPINSNIILEGIVQAIAKHEELLVVYSHYNIGEYSVINHMPCRPIEGLNSSRIFVNSGMFSPKKPDLDVLDELGKKIGADFLITMKASVKEKKGVAGSSYLDGLRCYLYSVKEKTLETKFRKVANRPGITSQDSREILDQLIMEYHFILEKP